MKILIAEDDAIPRLILQKSIEKFGHECLSAADGLAAWEMYQHSAVDVVVSDWMMPGLDGPGLCQRVREHAAGRYSYFIFLTSLSDKAHALTGMLAGADDYLIKPLDRDELQVKLIAAERVTALHRQLGEQKAELERLNRHLFGQAHRDPLTGLANRLQLGEDLDVLRSRVERNGHSYSIVLCDVDFFKRYNDSYGHLVLQRHFVLDGGTASCAGAIDADWNGSTVRHFLGSPDVVPRRSARKDIRASNYLRTTRGPFLQACLLKGEPLPTGNVVAVLAGDEVLRRVGQLLSGQSRAGDVAYRYGGEEFLLILPEQSLATATLVVERLRQAVERLAIAHSANMPAGVVTISAGLATFQPGEAKSVDTILQEADAALYRAKEAGRNRVAV